MVHHYKAKVTSVMLLESLPRCSEARNQFVTV